MKINPLPPVEVLQQYLAYNPDTGELTWRVQYGRGRVGSIVGNTCNKGYRTFQFHNRRLKAHRVCWAMYHNQDIPEGMIVDHINGDRADNRIINLRATTSLANNYNVHNRTPSESGVTGVYAAGNKWVATVGSSRVGTYSTFGEAVEAREAAVAKRLRDVTIHP